MFAIYFKDIRGFFSSVIAYVVIIVFLAGTGIFMWIVPGSNVFDNGAANLETLFNIAPWVFMFLVPAITMRSFAEERKTRTYETLVTKPVSDIQIIAGKFLANYTLVIFSLLPTLIYYLSVYLLASPEGNVDAGATFGSYLGLLFLAAVYTSVGIFASLISDSQIISFIISLFICFFFYSLLDMLRGLLIFGAIDSILEFLSFNTHYVSISRGIADTRDIIYFISFIALFITISKLLIEKRKW
jgi:ABC-2 type transport system permease protein